jgi:hypothetical protein
LQVGEVLDDLLDSLAHQYVVFGQNDAIHQGFLYWSIGMRKVI